MSDRIDTTLEVLIVSLANASRQAARCADMAETAIANGHRTSAIGCLLEADAAITRVALFRDTIIALHAETAATVR
jgi:hypothetical protein